jgi:hypothetical protein
MGEKMTIYTIHIATPTQPLAAEDLKKYTYQNNTPPRTATCCGCFGRLWSKAPAPEEISVENTYKYDPNKFDLPKTSHVFIQVTVTPNETKTTKSTKIKIPEDKKEKWFLLRTAPNGASLAIAEDYDTLITLVKSMHGQLEATDSTPLLVNG